MFVCSQHKQTWPSVNVRLGRSGANLDGSERLEGCLCAQALRHRDDKGERFARARSRVHRDVFAGAEQRDDRLLHGRGAGEALCLEHLQRLL